MKEEKFSKEGERELRTVGGLNTAEGGQEELRTKGRGMSRLLEEERISREEARIGKEQDKDEVRTDGWGRWRGLQGK